MALCGDKRYMTKNSCVLVHQLRAQTAGKLSEMTEEINNFNHFMGNLRNIYLENSDVDEEELDKLLRSELWLSSEKCLELGFVDEIIEQLVLYFDNIQSFFGNCLYLRIQILVVVLLDM